MKYYWILIISCIGSLAHCQEVFIYHGNTKLGSKDVSGEIRYQKPGQASYVYLTMLENAKFTLPSDNTNSYRYKFIPSGSCVYDMRERTYSEITAAKGRFLVRKKDMYAAKLMQLTDSAYTFDIIHRAKLDLSEREIEVLAWALMAQSSNALAYNNLIEGDFESYQPVAQKTYLSMGKVLRVKNPVDTVNQKERYVLSAPLKREIYRFKVEGLGLDQSKADSTLNGYMLRRITGLRENQLLSEPEKLIVLLQKQLNGDAIAYFRQL